MWVGLGQCKVPHGHDCPRAQEQGAVGDVFLSLTRVRYHVEQQSLELVHLGRNALKS